MYREQSSAVSVVIPAFNRARVLSRAVESVVNQTISVHEVIIVDDGSTDRTEDVCAELTKRFPSVRSVRLAKNEGANAARLVGIANATGDYVAFQDSDDVWLPDFVETLLPHAAEGRVVFGSVRIEHLNGAKEMAPACKVANCRSRLLRGTVFSMQSAILHRDLLPSDALDRRLRRFQDWDLWLNIARTTDAEFVHVAQPVAVLYRQADSISHTSPRVRARALTRILVRHRTIILRHPSAFARLVARIILPRRQDLSALTSNRKLLGARRMPSSRNAETTVEKN